MAPTNWLCVLDPQMSLMGAIKILIRRCGSERPGTVGSVVIGSTDDWCVLDGGGVGPVGELINHPTFND